MNTKRSILLTSLAMILILSSSLCVLPGMSEENGETEADLTATLASIQGTQTAIVAPPSATFTVEAMPTSPAPPPAETPTSSPEAQDGSLSGSLSFPSEGIPPLRVVAFNVNSGYHYYVETAANQGSYQIDGLPAGVYHVVAYPLEGGPGGGYSQAVPCGLSVDCTDHTLIDVQVNPGEITTGANPGDWYAPPGTFPPDPVAPLPGAGGPGSISGSLSFPSEYIPPLRVVAFDTVTGQYYYVLTVANQGAYIIENLPPGIYHVVAYALDSGLAGGYSLAVPCGLSVDCTDHSLVDVEVKSGEETSGIDPADWYAPAGSFPPDPAS